MGHYSEIFEEQNRAEKTRLRIKIANEIAEFDIDDLRLIAKIVINMKEFVSMLNFLKSFLMR